MKKYKNGENDNKVPNIIAQGTTIVGDIESDGDFRIEGSVVGSIKAKGRIVVGKSGKVDGEIICSNADICGTVNGKLSVTELTIFKSTADFSGDIITKKISIEPNAIFSGTCKMDAEKSASKNK